MKVLSYCIKVYCKSSKNSL